MAVGSIASHKQYLLSMHVLLITTAGGPLHGPELFRHTNGHKCTAAHTDAHRIWPPIICCYCSHLCPLFFFALLVHFSSHHCLPLSMSPLMSCYPDASSWILTFLCTTSLHFTFFSVPVYYVLKKQKKWCR